MAIPSLVATPSYMATPPHCMATPLTLLNLLRYSLFPNRMYDLRHRHTLTSGHTLLRGHTPSLHGHAPHLVEPPEVLFVS